MILMKRVAVYLLAITFMTTNSYSQDYKLTDREKYKSLIGEVYFLTLFVETHNGYWEDEEKEHYYKELLKGQTWIIENGKKYDQRIIFNNEHFLFNQSEIYISNLEEFEPRELYNEVLDKLSYQNSYHFINSNNVKLHPNKLRILLFIKSETRKHGFDYWAKEKSPIIKVYCSNTYGLMTDGYKISHEILHHFGAWDLCYGDSQSLEKANKAKALYPKSIMTKQVTWDSEVTIDELTAWRIGWNYKKREEFNQFRPNQEPRISESQTSIKFKVVKDKN